MKALLLSLSLVLMSVLAQADPSMSLLIEGVFSLPDGQTYDSHYSAPQGTVHTFNFTIKNTGTTDLVLSETGSVYVVLSGNAATQMVLDESSLTPTVPAGGSTTFSVTSKSTTPPADYSLSLYIANNDPNNSPFTGTVLYTISAVTAVVSAQEIGLTLSPVPSNDGRITINGSNVNVNKIVVYGPNGVSEPFDGAMSFHTRQKGVLVVYLYTDRGVVEEKILVQ